MRKYSVVFLVCLLAFNACTAGKYRVKATKKNKGGQKSVVLQKNETDPDPVNQEKIVSPINDTAGKEANIEQGYKDSNLQNKEVTNSQEKKEADSYEYENNIKTDKEVKYPPRDEENIILVGNQETGDHKFVWRKIKNDAFRVGEKLTFAIKWGLITAGYATLEVQEILEINGRKVYHIVAKAKSTPFFDTFFKVRDKTESFVDVESLCTWKFRKEINEGGYHSKKETIYDQKNNIAVTKGVETTTSPFVQDVLSAFYYLRTQDIKEGAEYNIDVHTNGKNWPLKVDVSKKETIKTKAGKYKTFCVEPHLREEGLFEQKGKLWIWLTDDAKKIPVLMESKILVGSIVVVLVEEKR